MHFVDTKRGTGRTTKQIEQAPPNAYFVWCCGDTYYAKMLCRKLGRSDITCIAPQALDNMAWALSRAKPMVADHAARLSEQQRAALNAANLHHHTCPTQ